MKVRFLPGAPPSSARFRRTREAQLPLTKTSDRERRCGELSSPTAYRDEFSRNNQAYRLVVFVLLRLGYMYYVYVLISLKDRKLYMLVTRAILKGESVNIQPDFQWLQKNDGH